MKKIYLSIFLFVFIHSNFCAQSNAVSSNHALTWQTSFEEAKSLSDELKKPILVFFTGSDWCGPCKMLVADFFESEKFIEEVSDSFILYKADFPRNRDLVSKKQRSTNNRLKGRYSVNTYPTLVIVNKKGKNLGKMKGYNLTRNTSYHYSFLEAVLKKFNKRSL